MVVVGGGGGRRRPRLVFPAAAADVVAVAMGVVVAVAVAAAVPDVGLRLVSACAPACMSMQTLEVRRRKKKLLGSIWIEMFV